MVMLVVMMMMMMMMMVVMMMMMMMVLVVVRFHYNRDISLVFRRRSFCTSKDPLEHTTLCDSFQDLGPLLIVCLVQSGRKMMEEKWMVHHCGHSTRANLKVAV